MVDVNAQIAAVARAVRTDEFDGAEVHVQSLAQTYRSPIDDVWDAVTSAERIPRWFLPVSGDLRLGGRYQFEGNAGGEVLACTPPTQGQEGSRAAGFRATWEYGGGVSWIEVTLRAEDDDSTRLELTHTARAGDLPPGFWELYGPGATGVGWDGGLLGLALHLGGSADLRPEDAAAWAFTDEGRSFYRAAADGWAQAQIDSSDDPGAARAAADATFAFYTGQTPVGTPEA